MKLIKNIALFGLATIGMSMGLSSCEDFLTITPTNQIVEEEFWQDKSDLNSAVTACYRRLIETDLLCKYIYWGEERSDNFTRSTNVSATGPVANILNGNLLPTYDQFNWEGMYNAINYCNKVLAHAPEVIAKDESFSENDWKPIRAEITTLRALCHFYLVRTFGEIPYITIDYNNDSQELRAPQSTQLAVLDSIIADLESVKDIAIIDYGNTIDNKGRITKKAVYALLADAYLWRASYKTGNNQPFKKVNLSSNYAGPLTEEELISRHEEYSTTAENDYHKCVEYCDLIIEMTTREKIEKINKSGMNIGGLEIAIELEDLLESNDDSNNKLPMLSGNIGAYNSIFGSGNSDESIFELQIDGSSNQNGMLTSIFVNVTNVSNGQTPTPPTMSQLVRSDVFENTLQDPNSPSYKGFTKTDYRRWESFVYDGDVMTKYELRSIEQESSPGITPLRNNDPSLTPLPKVNSTYRLSGNIDANWIVYRLSEIYLFKAEAMSQLYSDEENLKEAFKYVDVVFKRSNPYAYSLSNSSSSKDALNFASFSTSKDLESLIMSERQREFIGEGKRWYDLVRYALRRGSTSEMLAMFGGGEGIKAKLADIQSLFSPIYNQEIKNNNWLYQNGVWFVNETSSRTDEL